MEPRTPRAISATGLDAAIGLRDVARAIGVSIYHLCRTFRRATGFTLHQYRRVLKVRTSLEPVFDLDQSLIDIAIGLGFSSHSHSTSRFHREFGMPPSHIRPPRVTTVP